MRSPSPSLSPSPLLRICLTGPECVGKTTLARHLAARLGTVWVPEASRGYAEEHAGPLTAADVEPIARRQLQLDADATARAQAMGARHLVLDTDLVSTLVYADHYYGIVPPWVEERERERPAHLYLLCDIDVPWVADGVRDRPEHRAQLLALFRSALAARGAHVVEVRGDERTRETIAEEAVRRLDASSSPQEQRDGA